MLPNRHQSLRFRMLNGFNKIARDSIFQIFGFADIQQSLRIYDLIESLK